MPRISFALPVFNEQSGIDAFHAMTEALTARPDLDVESVYVNDGSLDESLARLIALQRADARIRIVDLSRNFGHQLAITAGIEHCTGDAVVIMDTDLQDPPAVSLELVAVDVGAGPIQRRSPGRPRRRRPVPGSTRSRSR